MVGVAARSVRIKFRTERVLGKVSVRSGSGRLMKVVKPGKDKGSALLGYVCHVLGPSTNTICLSNRRLRSVDMGDSTEGVTIITRRGCCGFSFAMQRIILVKHTPRGGTLRQSGTGSCQVIRRTLGAMRVSTFTSHAFSALSNKRRREIVLTETLTRRAPTLVLSRPAGRLSVARRVVLVRLMGGLGMAMVSTVRSLGVTTTCYSGVCMLGSNILRKCKAPRRMLAPRLVGEVCQMSSRIMGSDHKGVRVLFLWCGG